MHLSQSIVLKLVGLFIVDSFAGGLVVQSFVSYWFLRRFGAALLSVPFFVSGGLKIGYDLTLWRSIRAVRPPEERRSRGED